MHIPQIEINEVLGVASGSQMDFLLEQQTDLIIFATFFIPLVSCSDRIKFHSAFIK